MESGAVLTAAVLAFLIRDRRPAFGLTTVGTAFQVAAFGA